MIAISVYLPHKYVFGKSRDAFFQAFCEYHRVLREVALTIQRLKSQFGIRGVVLGVDGQVEVEGGVFYEQWPVTGPFVD
eukprot:6453873-Pyramimonas_sp.AAC.1